MYEDEFELTFDTPEEEPVYEPEKASAAPAPVPETTPAEIVPDEPTRVLEPRRAAPAEPAEPTPVSEPEPAEEPQPQSAAVPANGRTVLISGGDRGIGAAAARAFYAAGYRVAVLYHSNAEAAAALEAELPGFQKDEIKISVESDTLTLSAVHKEKTEEEKAKDGTYLRRERSTSSYEQKLDISNVDTSKLHAVYENGVLTLTMPKKQPAAPVSRQLEIH